jgi:23S rRNA (pseudouridine1915-N3)-methyltransferase
MPNIHLITIGKPKLSYAKAGIDEYLSRLKHYGQVTSKTLAEGSVQEEGKRLLDASDGMFRVILDERGRSCRSKELAQKLEDWDLRAVKDVAFLIGGANGHSPEVKEKADWLFSLGSLTLQHELALVVLLEQLYRAQTIRRGEPYHRE